MNIIVFNKRTCICINKYYERTSFSEATRTYDVTIVETD